jgi:hypothetical protein
MNHLKIVAKKHFLTLSLVMIPEDYFYEIFLDCCKNVVGV